MSDEASSLIPSTKKDPKLDHIGLLLDHIIAHVRQDCKHCKRLYRKVSDEHFHLEFESANEKRPTKDGGNAAS